MMTDYLIIWIYIYIITGCDGFYPKIIVKPKSLMVPERITLSFSCTVIRQQGPVIWQRPGDMAPVSIDSKVTDVTRYQVMVIPSRNSTARTYLLTVTYPLFSRDNGTWTCSHFGQETAQVYLHLFSKPTDPNPTVYPKNGTRIADHQLESHTFQCVAHNAYPPVTLMWVKVSGPDVTYDMLPPSHVMSPDGTSATIVSLMLTPANQNSVFTCIAIHPLYQKTVYKTILHYRVVFRKRPVHHTEAVTSSGVGRSVTSVGVIIIALLVVVGPVVIGCVVGYKKWRRKRRSQEAKRRPSNGSSIEEPASSMVPQNGTLSSDVEPTETSTALGGPRRNSRRSQGSVQRSQSNGQRSQSNGQRSQASITDKCRHVLLQPWLLLVVAFLAVVSLIPLHCNVKPPQTDQIPAGVQVIFTPEGSPVALDCTYLVTRYSTVIRVIWLRHRQPINIQYSDKINSQSLPDDTSGLSQLLQSFNLSSDLLKNAQSLRDKQTLGRVSSVKLGLIVLEKFSKEDTGAYTCVVSRVGQNGRGMKQDMKTVYIVTGSPTDLLTAVYRKYITDQVVTLVVTILAGVCLLAYGGILLKNNKQKSKKKKVPTATLC